MESKKNKKPGRALFIVLVIIIIAAAAVSAVSEIVAPESAVGSWFRGIIDVKSAWDSIKASSGTIGRGIILCAVVYCLGYLIRLILSKLMERSDRAKTVINIFSGFIKYACVIAIIFIILWLCGVNTTALWASIGVLALIIGLGCQSLIADIVAGLFIIFEDEFGVGEIIVVDGFRGFVQEIGIRCTKILDQAGDIKIINNSDIKNVVNLSRELSLAVCECGVEYQESIERIETVLSREMHTMAEKIPEIVDGPFYKGVSSLGDSSVVIKLVANCREADRYQVQRDMNRELKLIFDRNNISIPFPQIVLNKASETEPVKSAANSAIADRFVGIQKSESRGIEEQNN